MKGGDELEVAVELNGTGWIGIGWKPQEGWCHTGSVRQCSSPGSTCYHTSCGCT